MDIRATSKDWDWTNPNTAMQYARSRPASPDLSRKPSIQTPIEQENPASYQVQNPIERGGHENGDGDTGIRRHTSHWAITDDSGNYPATKQNNKKYCQILRCVHGICTSPEYRTQQNHYQVDHQSNKIVRLHTEPHSRQFLDRVSRRSWSSPSFPIVNTSLNIKF